MNIIRIDKDNLLNGEGIRVVVWTSGCSHHCHNCQNPETWDFNSGHEFNAEDKRYLFELLSKDYISGVTFSGGDPMYEKNRDDIFKLCREIKTEFPQKNIWLYTGYTLKELVEMGFISQISDIDVIVDGEFIENLKDYKYHWAGSTNQKILRKGVDY